MAFLDRYKKTKPDNDQNKEIKVSLAVYDNGELRDLRDTIADKLHNESENITPEDVNSFQGRHKLVQN